MGFFGSCSTLQGGQHDDLQIFVKLKKKFIPKKKSTFTVSKKEISLHIGYSNIAVWSEYFEIIKVKKILEIKYVWLVFKWCNIENIWEK